MDVMVKKEGLLTFFVKGTRNKVYILDKFTVIDFPNLLLIMTNYNKEKAQNKEEFKWSSNDCTFVYVGNKYKDIDVTLALTTIKKMTQANINLSSLSDDMSLLLDGDKLVDYDYFSNLLNELTNRSYKEFNNVMAEDLLNNTFVLKDNIIDYITEFINYIVGESNEF